MSEADRLAALEDLAVLGREASPEIRRLVRIARQLTLADHAHLCFIDRDWQWIVAEDGYTIPAKIARDQSICTGVIATGKALQICDLGEGSDLQQTILARIGASSYIGMPIKVSGGHVVGVIASTSSSARSLSTGRVEAFQDLSYLIARELLIQRNAQRRARQSETDVATFDHTTELRSLINAHLSVLRNVSDGVMIVRRDTTISFMNPAAEKLLNCSGEVLLGRPLTQLIHNSAPDQAEAARALAQSVADGVERFIRNLAFKGSGQLVLAAEAIATPIGATTSPMGTVIVFRRRASKGASNPTNLRDTLREINRFKERVATIETMFGTSLPPRNVPPLRTLGRPTLTNMKRYLQFLRDDQFARAPEFGEDESKTSAAARGSRIARWLEDDAGSGRSRRAG